MATTLAFTMLGAIAVTLMILTLREDLMKNSEK